MEKKAIIKYFTLTDEMRKPEKLQWFSENRLQNIPFETIHPDKDNNWLNLTDNDWETLLPLNEKGNKQTIFAFSSLGVSTNRDEWVYDFSKENLQNKIKFFIEKYNELLLNKDFTWNTEIKWSENLKSIFNRNQKLNY